MAKKTKASTSRPKRRRGTRSRRLTPDEAILAVLIAAMDANQHVSAEEAARAHHIIWSMRRFRDRSADAVNRLIESVRTRMEEDGVEAVLRQVARTIPARLRPSAFAVAVDLMLADTRLERAERQFVTRLASILGIPDARAGELLEAMQIKNQA